jgi:hypothetical protein
MAYATLQQRKVKGLTSIAVFDKTNPSAELMLVLPTPGTVELDPGITELLGTSMSELGEQVIESVEVSGQQPVVNCTFSAMSPQLLSLRLMRSLETKSDTFNIEKRRRLAKNSYPAAATGEEGNGIVADQTGSVMSIVGSTGISTALARVAFDGFDTAATDDSFAQGADGAFKVSDNLVGYDVAYSFPQTITAVLGLSETPITDLRLNFTAVMSDLKLFRVEIPSVTIDREGSGNIPLTAGEMSLNFRVTYDGSTCTPISYKFIEQLRAC